MISKTKKWEYAEYLSLSLGYPDSGNVAVLQEGNVILHDINREDAKTVVDYVNDLQKQIGLLNKEIQKLKFQ